MFDCFDVPAPNFCHDEGSSIDGNFHVGFCFWNMYDSKNGKRQEAAVLLLWQHPPRRGPRRGAEEGEAAGMQLQRLQQAPLRREDVRILQVCGLLLQDLRGRFEKLKLAISHKKSSYKVL